jgi:hypothetical protein
MQPDIVRGIFVNGAENVECLHQPHRPERKANTSSQDASSQLTDFQTAAAQIKNESRRVQISHRPERRHPDQARLFLAGDNFKIDLCQVPQAFDKNVAIAGLASSAGGNGAIGHDAVAVHDPAKLAEGRGCIAERLAIEFSGCECGVAQAHRRADGLDNLPIIGRMDTGDNQPERVRARINRGEMQWFG